MADSLILMVLALVVFGPRRLPQIGRQIGKLMYEFRKASNDFKFQMEEELRNAEDAERRKKEEEQRRTLALTSPAQESVSAEPAVVNAIESPYPGEGHYPPETTPVASPAEEITPRIQPPSTGEQVPATRPSRMAGLEQPAAEAVTEPEAVPQAAVEAAPQAEAAPAQPATEPTQTATEAVSHNG
jgi:sec-independent protein translocase protein TatB